MKLLQLFVLSVFLMPIFAMEERANNDPLRIRALVHKILEKQSAGIDTISVPTVPPMIGPNNAYWPGGRYEPLLIAVSMDDAYTDFLDELFKRNADIQRTSAGVENTLIHAAAPQAPLNLRKILARIKQKGVARMINQKNDWGATPLISALGNINYRTTLPLLESGADVHSLYTTNVIYKRTTSRVRISPLSYLFYMFSITNIPRGKDFNNLSLLSRYLLLYGADPTWTNYSFVKFELRGKEYEKAVKINPDAVDFYKGWLCEYDKNVVKQAFGDIKFFHDLKSVDLKDSKSYLSRLLPELFAELRSFTAGINASKRMDACLPVQSYEEILNHQDTA